MIRITELQFLHAVVDLLAQRSTCVKGKVGAIAIRDGRIIATGYNGAPSGEPHCIDVGCDIVDGCCVRTVHAETNLISIAARFGISLEGTDIYCSKSPCLICARLLLNAKIESFTYFKEYKDLRGTKLLFDHGILILNRCKDEKY